MENSKIYGSVHRLTQFADGFSLLEVVVALSIGSLLLVLVFQFFLDLWRGYVKTAESSDYTIVAMSMKRIWNQDIHAASWASMDGAHELTLILVDGTDYEYYVNAKNQLIRVRQGGGTTVLAVGVRNLDVRYDAGVISCRVTFVGSDVTTMLVTPVGTVETHDKENEAG